MSKLKATNELKPKAINSSLQKGGDKINANLFDDTTEGKPKLSSDVILERDSTPYLIYDSTNPVIVDLQHHIRLLQSERDRLRTDNSLKDKEIDALKVRLNEAMNFKHDNNDTQAVKFLTEENNKLKLALKKLEEQYRVKDAEATPDKNSTPYLIYDSTNPVIVDLQHHIRLLQSERDRLRTDNSLKDKEIDALKVRLNEAMNFKHYNNDTQAVKFLTEENNKLKLALKKLEEQYRVKDAEATPDKNSTPYLIYDSTNPVIVDLQHHIRLLQSERDRLRTDNSLKDKEIDALKVRLNEAMNFKHDNNDTQAVKFLTEENAKLKLSLKKLDEQVASDKFIVDLQHHIKLLKSERDRLRTDNSLKDKEIDALKVRLNEAMNLKYINYDSQTVKLLTEENNKLKLALKKLDEEHGFKDVQGAHYNDKLETGKKSAVNTNGDLQCRCSTLTEENQRILSSLKCKTKELDDQAVVVRVLAQDNTSLSEALIAKTKDKDDQHQKDTATINELLEGVSELERVYSACFPNCAFP